MEDETGFGSALDEIVNNVQQLRNTLNLVDDDDLLFGRACHQLAEPFRARGHLPVDVRLQQVQLQGFGETVLQPRGIAGTARPEEEEALVRDRQESRHNFHFGTQSGISDAIMLAPLRALSTATSAHDPPARPATPAMPIRRTVYERYVTTPLFV